MVYDHLDLPPISLASLGLVLSCREALAETEQAVRPQLNRRLLVFKAAAEGHAVISPKLSDKSTFKQMSTIGIGCPKEPLYYDGNSEALLGCCFAKVSFLYKGREQFQAPVCKIAPVLIRTKCITMVWGETRPYLISEVQDFKYLEGSYSKSHKDNMRRNGVSPRDYAWPTWRRFSRKDGTAGMISLSSDYRWANSLDRRALKEEMVAKKKALDFWSSCRDASMG